MILFLYGPPDRTSATGAIELSGPIGFRGNIICCKEMSVQLRQSYVIVVTEIICNTYSEFGFQECHSYLTNNLDQAATCTIKLLQTQ